MGISVLVVTAMAAAAQWFDFGPAVDGLLNGVVYTLRTAEDVWPEWRQVITVLVFTLLLQSIGGFAASVLFRGAVPALVAALGFGLALDCGARREMIAFLTAPDSISASSNSRHSPLDRRPSATHSQHSSSLLERRGELERTTEGSSCLASSPKVCLARPMVSQGSRASAE